MAKKHASSIVPTVPTPLPVNHKTKFDKTLNDLLKLLKSINFNDYKEKNWIDLDDITLLAIEDYIIELSKPQYKEYLENLEIPSRPAKSSSTDESLYEEELKKYDLDIKCRHYIKELISVYSIYHNHQNRNYFFALCSHLSSSYSRRNPDEEIHVVFRFKSPKGLILKLAKNIFLNGYFHRDPLTNIDTFKYRPLNDVFGFKIIAKKGFNPTTSRDENTQSLIDKRNDLYKKIYNFDLFLEDLNNSPSSVTNMQYLEYCKEVLTAIKDGTIHANEEQLINYLNSEINKVDEEFSNLETTDSLNAPLDSTFIKNFKFKHWLAKYKKRIDAPLTLKGLKKGINSILNPPQNMSLNDEKFIEYTTTKYFNISVTNTEEKHTSSGHEGIHCDIQTPKGNIELQLQTESQYESDKYGETNSHGLMTNKGIPVFPIPKTYTLFQKDSDNYELINSDGMHFTYPKSSLYEAIDSSNKHFYFVKEDVNHYIRLVELYTAKKGEIIDNPVEETSTVRMFSSLDNYKSISLELPANNSKRAAFQEYFSRLSDKSQSILKILFHHSSSYTTNWDTSKIATFISQYQNDNNIR